MGIHLIFCFNHMFNLSCLKEPNPPDPHLRLLIMFPDPFYLNGMAQTGVGLIPVVFIFNIRIIFQSINDGKKTGIYSSASKISLALRVHFPAIAGKLVACGG